MTKKRVEILDELQRYIVHKRNSMSLDQLCEFIREYDYPVDLSAVDDINQLLMRVQEAIDAERAEVPDHSNEEEAPGLKGHTGPRPKTDFNP